MRMILPRTSILSPAHRENSLKGGVHVYSQLPIFQLDVMSINNPDHLALITQIML